jgi:hypothetical protein
MALDDDQLALLLQVCTDFAKQMIEEQGGFYPFGARVKPDGEIDFVQPVPESDPVDIQALYRKATELLAGHAQNGELLAAAVVANADLPDDDIKWLDARAAEQGKSRVAMLREVVEWYRGRSEKRT